MGKPHAPDPQATAAAQTQSNKDTAISNANLNRVDQYSPLGSSTYKVVGTNPDGTPHYEQTTALSAPMQGIFDSQLANQQHGQDISTNLLNNVAAQYSKPVDTSHVNALSTSAGPAATANTGNFVTSAGNGGGDIQRSLGIDSVPHFIKGAQDAAYANQMAYLNPQFKNQNSDLNSQLAAQGITQGSAAWDRAQSELSRNQTFAQQQAQNSAFNQGLAGGNTAFGIIQGAGNFANQAQQQGFDQSYANAGLANHAADQQTAVNLANAQMQQQQGQFNAGLNNAAHAQGMQDTFATYNQPLNTYNQLQSGAQAQQPTFNAVPTVGMAPTDVSGIINNAYGNQVGAYNGFMGGLGSLAGAAMMAPKGTFAFSDKRLKENISKVGETPGGNNLYMYNYKGDVKPQIGVIAQELRKKQPEAVANTPSGYLAVDYSKVK